MRVRESGGRFAGMETTNAKPAPDWEKIEADYRAGIKTLRQIAGEHGVSHVAINKRAKRDGWSRDLSAKIAAKADELVTKGAVTSAVTTESRISEREIIDANAQAIVSVRLSHRRDIQRSRRIAMALLEELEQQAGGEQVAMLEQLGELLRSEDDKGQDKLNDLYHKVISLPGRAKTMKDLGESLRVLVTLERQAFGLDNAGTDGDSTNSPTKQLTDAERAVRLSRLMSGNPDALAVLLQRLGGGNGA